MAVDVPAGFSVRVHSGDAPVFCDVAVIMPLLASMAATYFVTVVEQPAAVVSTGYAVCEDEYSATEVLHAAMAAMASDIFERIT